MVKLLVFNCNLHNSAAISKPKSLLLENVRQKMRVTHFNQNGERNNVHYIFFFIDCCSTVTALLENCHHIVTDKMEMRDILYFLILPQKAGKIQFQFFP